MPRKDPLWVKVVGGVMGGLLLLIAIGFLVWAAKTVWEAALS